MKAGCVYLQVALAALAVTFISASRCSFNEFDCLNGQCLPYLHWECDGYSDCLNRHDELNCGSGSGSGDDDNDDDDGIIEIDGSGSGSGSGACSDMEFECYGFGNCIPSTWVCDGMPNCGNAEDEQNCYKPVIRSTTTTQAPKPACSKDQFQCAQEILGCIPASWQCDGAKECADGSDEADCFHCQKSGSIIPNAKVCDQYRDCFYGEDESSDTCLGTSTAETPATTTTVTVTERLTGIEETNRLLEEQSTYLKQIADFVDWIQTSLFASMGGADFMTAGSSFEDYGPEK